MVPATDRDNQAVSIFRLDGQDPSHPERVVPPPPGLSADVLAGVIRAVAAVVWFATVPHPARPKGWDITWGAQVDPRVVRLTDNGEVTDVAVASYLAPKIVVSVLFVAGCESCSCSTMVAGFWMPSTRLSRMARTWP